MLKMIKEHFKYLNLFPWVTVRLCNYLCLTLSSLFLWKAWWNWILCLWHEYDVKVARSQRLEAPLYGDFDYATLSGQRTWIDFVRQNVYEICANFWIQLLFRIFEHRISLKIRMREGRIDRLNFTAAHFQIATPVSMPCTNLQRSSKISWMNRTIPAVPLDPAPNSLKPSLKSKLTEKPIQ